MAHQSVYRFQRGNKLSQEEIDLLFLKANQYLISCTFFGKRKNHKQVREAWDVINTLKRKANLEINFRKEDLDKITKEDKELIRKEFPNPPTDVLSEIKGLDYLDTEALTKEEEEELKEMMRLKEQMDREKGIR